MNDERRVLAVVARGGMCSWCRHARLIRSARGSFFVRCTYPDLPKYPRVPVVQCRGFSLLEELLMKHA